MQIVPLYIFREGGLYLAAKEARKSDRLSWVKEKESAYALPVEYLSIPVLYQIYYDKYCSLYQTSLI